MLLHEDVLAYHPPGLAVGEHVPLRVLGDTHRPVAGTPVREETGQGGLYLVNLPVLASRGVRIEEPYCPTFRQHELYGSSNETSPPLHRYEPRGIPQGTQRPLRRQPGHATDDVPIPGLTPGLPQRIFRRGRTLL